MKVSAALRNMQLLLLGSLTTGCVYYLNEYDPCMGKSECPDSGESTTSSADGGSVGLGGEGSGFSVSGGGPAASSGGVGSGGLGGDDSSGSAGGDFSGGGDGDATTSLLVINEVKVGVGGYVEVFNAGSSDVELQRHSLARGASRPLVDDSCSLLSAGTLEAGEFLELTAAATCRGPEGCMTNCSWAVELGQTLFLLEGVGVEARVVDQLEISPELQTLIGKSYAAYPDGSGLFGIRTQSPAEANTQD